MLHLRRLHGEAAILRLLEGFRRFRATNYRKNRNRYAELARGGQSPSAMVISCCDSRVDPGLIFSTEPGDIFVVRNVANLVPPYERAGSYHGTSAALEFAVRTLLVQHIVVLGHARCGGVRALYEGGSDGDFIGPWMDIARPARDRALAAAAAEPGCDALRLCEHESIKVSLANLVTFPWIRDRVEAGALALHGWFFDIETGELHAYDPGADGFVRAQPALIKQAGRSAI